MVFVLSFVISTWAIVAALAGPIAVPAPFPGGKIFCLHLLSFIFLLKFSFPSTAAILSVLPTRFPFHPRLENI